MPNKHLLKFIAMWNQSKNSLRKKPGPYTYMAFRQPGCLRETL